jgi:hypothetical protein
MAVDVDDIAGVDGTPISLGKYAEHLGVSKQAVSVAISRGRLTDKSVIRVNEQPKIRSITEADREWRENSRRPRTPDVPHPDVQRLRLSVDRFVVCRTRDFVAIQSCTVDYQYWEAGSHSLVCRAEAGSTFEELVEENCLIFAMKPEAARRLAELLLLKAESAPDVEELPK